MTLSCFSKSKEKSNVEMKRHLATEDWSEWNGTGRTNVWLFVMCVCGAPWWPRAKSVCSCSCSYLWWLQCAVRPKAAFCIPRRAVSLITGRDTDYRMCRARAGFKGCCWFWAAVFVTTPNGSCRGCHFWALGSHPVPYMRGVIRHHSPLRAVRKRESCSLESWGRCLLGVRLLKWIN